MHKQPLTLALETSSRLGSVALGRGPELITQQDFSGPLRHSTEVLPTIAALMQQINATAQDINSIALSIGPGSFTGLRIAVSLVKSMHLAHPCQIVTISSLAAVAANVHEPPCSGPYRLAPVLDAKRNQFFTTCFRCNPQIAPDPTPIFEETLLSADEILTTYTHPEEPLYLLGDGLVYYRDKFIHPQVSILPDSLWSPQAAEVYRLGWQKAQAGEFADPLTLVPNYLREALVTPKPVR